jgi:Cobalamin biosynthesis protein CbiG
MTAVTVISLTPAGRALAERLRHHLPEAEYLHRPLPFQASVRERFRAGRRLVLICATGIAVRTLTPVLTDKYHDPAVLVMDERGRFVIPLLSGHQGGGNAWAQWLSEAIGAHCVLTSHLSYTHPLLVAGMGCERHCPVELLAELLDTTLCRYDLSRGDLHALASLELKRDEVGLLALAHALDIPLVFYPASTLACYSDRLSDKSEIVFRETGCYGVAEAAALAHAEQLSGSRAELLIPKHKNAHATFALARAYGAPEIS